MSYVFKISAFILVSFCVSSPAAPYKLDMSHSNILFKVKHLVVATVTGRFDKFDATFDFDPVTGVMKDLVVNIDSTTVNTNDGKRDTHLKGADFFNVEKFKNISYKSDKIASKSKKPSSIEGTVNLLGQSKPLLFNVNFKGTVQDPWGNERAVFEATSQLKRSDFGMTWNKNLDKGGLMISDEVTIVVEAEAIKVAAAKN